MDFQIHLAGMEGKNSLCVAMATTCVVYIQLSSQSVWDPPLSHTHTHHHGNSPGAVLATSGVESYLKTVGVASSEAVGVASSEAVGVASSEAVVVVDSLSTLLLNQSVAQVCRLLHQLGRLPMCLTLCWPHATCAHCYISSKTFKHSHWSAPWRYA